MFVTKRDGSSEPVRFDKITSRLQKLCWGLSIDPAVIAQKVVAGIFPGITTTELDRLAAETAAYSSVVEPEYETLAARIEVSNLHKNTDKKFSDVVERLANYENPHTKKRDSLVSRELRDVVEKHKSVVDDAVDDDRDYDFTYFGFKTLERSYLMKINDRVVERPQHLLMRVAIGIYGDDIEKVLMAYSDMSKKLYTHATPTLFNAGTPRPQMSSCFLLDMNEDSIKGIFKTLGDCATISKYAGGIGLAVQDIRATNSYIAGTNGKSNGLTPMLRVFNDTARYCDQGGGRRKGSFAVYLEPWHADIFEFLDLKKNHGKEESRARDLFYALWIPDLFMERVKSGGDWTLMCPAECPGLTTRHSDDFKRLYERYESENRGRQTIKAQKLWFKILVSQIETGTPYMLYKDAANSKSNHQHLGTIKSSNLCVAGETKILTSDGYVSIASLQDCDVDVWNGEEFSRVTVRQTGKDVDLLRVKLSNGAVLRCTPYHKFVLAEGYSGRSRVLPASELKAGDKLVKFELPVIEHGEDFEHAYTHGLFCADGTTSCNSTPRPCGNAASVGEFCKKHLGEETVVDTVRRDGICRAISSPEVKYLDLYGSKKCLEPHIKFIGNVYENSKSDRRRYRLPPTIPEKFVVPVQAKISDKLEWLAGYFDGDGTVVRHSGDGGRSIQACSIHKDFLVEILLMLQTIGVHSKVRPASATRRRLLPDGRGGKKEYSCKPTFRLLIASEGVEQLVSLGFHPRRLDVAGGRAQRSARRFVEIEEVVDDPTPSDTFCFNEPKRHRGMFAGILTSNCTEILQYTSPEETAVCNLASVNLSKMVVDETDETDDKVTTRKFDFDKLHCIVERVTENLNQVIDKNFYPTPEARRSNLFHRPIGIGVQGLADAFLQLELAWDSPEARKLNVDIFETIYHAAMAKTIALARRDGPYKTYEGSPLSQGKLQFDLWKESSSYDDTRRYDWDDIRRDLARFGARNSLLVAPMPTASTSQILGNNECFEPFTANIYSRRTLAGEFHVINKHLVKKLKSLNQWNDRTTNQIIADRGSVKNLDFLSDAEKNLFRTVWEIPQRIILDMAADRARYICQSQSLNIHIENPTTGKLTSMHFYAWKKGLKTGMYYLRSQPRVHAIQFTVDEKLLKKSNDNAIDDTEECLACGS